MINNKVRAALETSLTRLPGGSKLRWLISYYRLRRGLGAGGHRKPKDIFTYMYDQNRWDNAESVSGPGSTLMYTENIRRELPKLIQELDIRSILDAPCGDYNWFRSMERLTEFDYVGGDIVSALIARNQQAFGSATTSFVELDIINQPIPPADMWLCRDVLLHFSYERIFRTLANLLRSEVKYFLASSYTEARENFDIPTGEWRQVNLELSPFGLGPPMTHIDDWIEGYPVRKLCLWRRSDLAERLRANVEFLNAAESDYVPNMSAPSS
jgi:SAM-dependent methyltransferase